MPFERVDAGALRLVDVQVTLGRNGRRTRVLEPLSLDIRPAELTCILGPSGSGKSTLLNVLAGLIRPDRGEVLLDGRRVDGPGPERGVVFQQPTLFPWLTLSENVAFAALARGAPPDDEDVRRWLRAVGLSRHGDEYPDALSGGMQQRGCIARALAARPRVILLDEPFSALDPQTRIFMQELLMSVWEDLRTTVVFVTHDIDEAIRLGDRILVLSAPPARVLVDLTVPFARPRDASLLFDDDFLLMKRRIFDLRASGERALLPGRVAARRSVAAARSTQNRS